MIETKMFEVRDRATFIPMLATAVGTIGMTERESWMAHRCGYSPLEHYVILLPLDLPDKATYDEYDWGGNRTRMVAHKYIRENWSSLKSGDVICVETILGERTKPKKSEMEDDR